MALGVEHSCQNENRVEFNDEEVKIIREIQDKVMASLLTFKFIHTFFCHSENISSCAIDPINTDFVF